MCVLYPLLPPAAAVFVMRHLWPPRMIYLKWQEKYYSCFYGILHQLLLMSPLASEPPHRQFSSVLRSSGMLGNPTPSREQDMR